MQSDDCIYEAQLKEFQTRVVEIPPSLRRTLEVPSSGIKIRLPVVLAGVLSLFDWDDPVSERKLSGCDPQALTSVGRLAAKIRVEWVRTTPDANS